VVKLRCVIMGPNVFFVCIKALIHHLSIQFLDIDFQDISGKHPENFGNFLSQTGFFPGIYFLRLVFISWKFPCLIGCGLASALLVTEIS
jgi:hypothetical protein